MEELINSFKIFGVSNEKQILMSKMRSVDNKYGVLLDKLGIVLEEIILLYGTEELFKDLKLNEIIYGIIDCYTDDYIKYINNFIKYMRENIPNNMIILDILYCIKNY
jgi:hypothetical protein